MLLPFEREREIERTREKEGGTEEWRDSSEWKRDAVEIVHLPQIGRNG